MTVSDKRFPNFFILGAPKSGTTALSEYLRQHPDVLFSQPKEPHFFNDDFSHRHIESMDAYLKCFSQGNGQEHAVGEGSVFYLYSKTAVSNIMDLIPQARFIVMLRHPVEAAYSWHWQAMYSFGEDVEDFEIAWRSQKKRRSGEGLPPHNRVREALQYGPLFSYAEQLERLFELVPHERVHVILYDDFKKNTAFVYQQALNFLSLSPFYLQTYQRINTSKRLRWPFVERMVAVVGRIKQSLGIRRGLGLLSFTKRMNTKYERRPSLLPSFRSELEEYFKEDVLRTAKLIDRNLSGWIHG